MMTKPAKAADRHRGYGSEPANHSAEKNDGHENGEMSGALRSEGDFDKLPPCWFRFLRCFATYTESGPLGGGVLSAVDAVDAMPLHQLISGRVSPQMVGGLHLRVLQRTRSHWPNGRLQLHECPPERCPAAKAWVRMGQSSDRTRKEAKIHIMLLRNSQWGWAFLLPAATSLVK